MDELYGCERARPLLAEVATGALAGQERAAALRHVAQCPSCRAELAELAKVADGLLLLAPAIEPPAGFESTVAAALRGDTRPRRERAYGLRLVARHRRVLAAAAAVVIAAALGAGGVWWQTAPDRTLASQTRENLERANGRYLHASRIINELGGTVGAIFLYQGNPSWLLVSLSAAPADGSYDVVLVRRDGRAYSIGACQIADGTGTVAYQLTAPVDTIAAVRMTGPNGVHLTAAA